MENQVLLKGRYIRIGRNRRELLFDDCHTSMTGVPTTIVFGGSRFSKRMYKVAY